MYVLLSCHVEYRGDGGGYRHSCLPCSHDPFIGNTIQQKMPQGVMHVMELLGLKGGT